MGIFHKRKIVILVLTILMCNFSFFHANSQGYDYNLNIELDIAINEDRSAHCKYMFNFSPLKEKIVLSTNFLFSVIKKTDLNSIKIYWISELDPNKHKIEIESLTNEEIKTKGGLKILNYVPVTIVYEFTVLEAFIQAEEGSSLEIWEDLVHIELGSERDFNFYAEIKFPYGHEFKEEGYIPLVGVRTPPNFQVERVKKEPITITISGRSFDKKLDCPILFYYVKRFKPEILLNLTDSIYLKDFQDIRVDKNLSVSNLTDEDIIFCMKRDKNDFPILYTFGEYEGECDSIYTAKRKDTEEIRGVEDYPLSEEKITTVRGKIWYPFDKYKVNLKYEISSLFEKGPIDPNYKVRYCLIINEPKYFCISGKEDNYIKIWPVKGKITIPKPLYYLSEYKEGQKDNVFYNEDSFSCEVKKNEILPVDFVLDSVHSNYEIEISLFIERDRKWIILSALFTLLSWISVFLESKYKKFLKKIPKEINMSPLLISISQISIFYIHKEIFPIDYIVIDKLVLFSFLAFIASLILNWKSKRKKEKRIKR